MSVKNYNYGVRVNSKESLANIRDMCKKYNDCYNGLIETENNRRQEFESIRKDNTEGISILEKEINEIESNIDILRSDIKKLNSSDGKKPRPELTVKIKNLKELKTAKFVQLKSLKHVFKSKLEPANTEFKKRINIKLKEIYPDENSIHGPHIKKKITKIIYQDMLNEDWPQEWKNIKTSEISAKENANKILKKDNSKLNPGTYLLVQAAVDAAKTKVKAGRLYKSFDGYSEGRVGIQINGKKGVSFTFKDIVSGKCKQIKFVQSEKIINVNNKLSVYKHREKNNSNKTESIRHHNCNNYYNVSMFIGVRGEEREKNKYIDFSVLIHRPIPDDAIIKNIQLIIKRNNKYTLQFTLESNLFSHTSNSEGICAVDLGWRKFEDKLRVGYFAGTDGAHDEICIPIKISNSLKYCRFIQSCTDKHFNDARNAFVLWLKNNSTLLSVEINEDLKYIHLWKSAKKLARISFILSNELFNKNIINNLWSIWKSNRSEYFAPYNEILDWCKLQNINDTKQQIVIYLEWWRRKNKHLYFMQTNLREKTLLHRRELYRLAAHKLHEKYNKIGLENMDLTAFQVNLLPEEFTTQGKIDDEKIKDYRLLVAPSEFRQAIELVFGKENIIKYPKEYTTMTHNRCGHINSKTNELLIKCEKCGDEYDRDQNGALNGLVLTCERLGNDKSAVGARSGSINAEFDKKYVDNPGSAEHNSVSKDNLSQTQL